MTRLATFILLSLLPIPLDDFTLLLESSSRLPCYWYTPGGWKFTCRDCGYYARYTETGGEATLVILFGGDPDVRHESSQDHYSEPYQRAGFGDRL